MNEPYVLGALRRMLAIYDRTGILSESSDVYKGLVGVGPAAKAEYLKNYRENYFAVFTALSDEEKPFRIEASLDSLVVFWNDSHQRYISADDGIGMDGVVWSLIKTYHQETVYFICFLYRCSLLFPTDELYDIEGKFKGLQLKDVHQVIYDAGLLTLKRIASLEEQIKKTSKKKEPFGGKILGIPWSGEEAVDSISAFFEDSSSLNMGVITEMGKRFRQICRGKARDKNSTREEKEIWIRAVINALNALYAQANRSHMDMIYELSASYCAIVEEEFMQIPEPICVKQLAAEIDATEVFEDVIFLANASPEGSTIPCTYNQYLLAEDMGEANLELYQKKLCDNCEIEGCPYDLYWRKYQMDGIGIPGKYDFSPEKEKEITQTNYIEDCHSFLCSPSIIKFLDAVCLSLSIPPKWQDSDFDEHKKTTFIKKNIVPQDRYYYDHFISLTSELTDNIKCLKDNEIELSNFIDDFLSPFYELSVLLRPIGREETDFQRFILFTCASGLVNCSFKDFQKTLADSIETVLSRHPEEDYECTIDLIKEILERAPQEEEIPKDRIFAAIHEIKTSLSLVEASLEAALLNAGITNDYIYYEEEVGMNLGRRVNDVLLYLVTCRTPQSLVSRIKRLGHRTAYGIKEDEDMYQYVKRYFSGEEEETTPSASNDDNRAESKADTCPEEASELDTEPQPTFELPDKMQECLLKAKHYLPGGHWWNNNKRQYGFFLKVLYYEVFEKKWGDNVRWVQLPNFPLKDGTVLTIEQIKGAIRNYSETADGGTRKTYENLFRGNGK